MLYADVRDFSSNIILDPYTLKDLRLLVSWARQDFINSALNLRTLQLAEREMMGWGKRRRIEKAIRVAHAEIREKRVVIDDLERALEIAENNDHEENERRDFYIKALMEAADGDDERYGKRLEKIEEEGNRHSDRELLIDIRKQLAEIYFSIDKIDNQRKRRKKWQLYGPPSQIRDEFKKYYHHEPETSEDVAPCFNPEEDEFGERVLCVNGNCIGVVGDDGCCKVCGTPHPDFNI
jgi:hypothetical protein